MSCPTVIWFQRRWQEYLSTSRLFTPAFKTLLWSPTKFFCNILTRQTGVLLLWTEIMNVKWDDISSLNAKRKCVEFPESESLNWIRPNLSNVATLPFKNSYSYNIFTVICFWQEDVFDSDTWKRTSTRGSFSKFEFTAQNFDLETLPLGWKIKSPASYLSVTMLQSRQLKVASVPFLFCASRISQPSWLVLVKGECFDILVRQAEEPLYFFIQTNTNV